MKLREKIKRIMMGKWVIPEELGGMDDSRGVYFPEKPTKPPTGLVPEPPPAAARGTRKQILANWQALLRVARAARAYDYCNDDDIERKGFLLRRMRKALKEVEHLL